VDRAIARVHSLSVSKDSLAIISTLLKVLETKDPYLRDHSTRVAALASRLAQDIGLSWLETQHIDRASLVHDLGKIGVPETILNKPGPLTPEEYDQVKKHPVYSAFIVRDLKEFRDCVHYVYHHHERFDGGGYPDGLAGKDIPLGARVIAVCDAYDAMSSNRPYRSALSSQAVHWNLVEARGRHLDGELVDVFLERQEKPS
jgi:putative nucleotidyltransferase with HDIG domain